MLSRVEFARLTGPVVIPDPITSLATRSQDGIIVFAPDGGDRRKARLDVARALLAASVGAVDVSLSWCFSGMKLDSARIAAALRSWEESGQPPVLDLVALIVSDDAVATRGLAAFAGQEIVMRGPPETLDDRARTTARLAANVLGGGALTGTHVRDVSGNIRAIVYQRDSCSGVNQVIVDYTANPIDIDQIMNR